MRLYANWVALTMLALIAVPRADAQVALKAELSKPVTGLYIGARTGIGFYGGDLDAQAAIESTTSRSSGFELAWQVTPGIGVGGVLQSGSYPKVSSTQTFQSLQGFVRLFPTQGRFSPYFQLGYHRTSGGLEPAKGPLAGAGLSVTITQKVYLYGEATLMAASPDGAIDGLAGGAGFDQLGFVGAGIRLANLGVKYERGVKITDIENRPQFKIGEPAQFIVRVADGATKPIEYTWEFDGGAILDGDEVTYVFVDAGVHEVIARATNSGGGDLKRIEVTVLPEVFEGAIAQNQLTPPYQNRPVTPPSAESRTAEVTTGNSAATDPEPVAENTTEEPVSTDPPPVTARETEPDISTPPAGDPGGQSDTTRSEMPDQPAVEEPVIETARPKEVDLGSVPAASVPARSVSTSESIRLPNPQEYAATYPSAMFYTWVVSTLPEPSMAEKQAIEHRRSGRPAFVVPGTLNGRRIYRVTIGEWATQLQAINERTSILPAEMQLATRLIRIDGPAPDPFATASEYADGFFYSWVVASRTDIAVADQESTDLRKKGYRSFVVPELVGGNQTNRVIIGEWGSQQAAIESKDGAIPESLRMSAWLTKVSADNEIAASQRVAIDKNPTSETETDAGAAAPSVPAITQTEYFGLVVKTESTMDAARSVANDYRGDGFQAQVIVGSALASSVYYVVVGAYDSLDRATSVQARFAGILPNDTWPLKFKQ